jgi:glycosyltransferase involved in cell wall biosynthesis
VKKLSVITVNLNNLIGLNKTMESILNQSFSDFEYIIIDGGSTDGSLDVIQQLDSAAIQNYQWISEADSGVYEAMNKGIRLAKGEYLLFLNSGDCLVNEKVLEDTFSKPHTAEFLLGRCNVSDKGIVIHTIYPPETITFGFLYYNGLNHQSTFIKNEMFLKHGYYREDFRYNADIEFWYRTIILQNCSTETLSTTITDYNTDGISSKESYSDAYQKELVEIYSHPLLRQFIPDYDAWKREKQEMEAMYWLKSKKKIYSILQSTYKFACWCVKLRK